MKVGMFFTSLAFVNAAILEMFIDDNVRPSIAWQVSQCKSNLVYLYQDYSK